MAVQSHTVPQTGLITSRIVMQSGGVATDHVTQNVALSSSTVTKGFQTLRSSTSAYSTATGAWSGARKLTSTALASSSVKSNQSEFVTNTITVSTNATNGVRDHTYDHAHIASAALSQRLSDDTVVQSTTIVGRAVTDFAGILGSSATATDQIRFARRDKIASTANTVATVVGGGDADIGASSGAIVTSHVRWQGESSQQVTSTASVAAYTQATSGKDVLVVNSNTGAVSRYADADIITVLDTSGGLVIVTSQGFAIPGADDITQPIHAAIEYAPTDYKLSGEFRLENVWVDLQGGTDLTATITTRSSIEQTYTYPLEFRGTSVPRTTRFVPGRGMVGRYWAIRIQGSQPFNIVDLTADVAESRRRV